MSQETPVTQRFPVDVQVVKPGLFILIHIYPQCSALKGFPSPADLEAQDQKGCYKLSQARGA